LKTDNEEFMEESDKHASHGEIASLKKVVKGASVFLTGVVISKFITYFTRLFIARYFGPEDYGMFSLGLAVVGLVGTFGVLGLHAGVTRYVPYHKTRNEEAQVKGVLVFSLGIVCLASVILGAAMFLFSSQIAVTIFNKPELDATLKILAFSIPFASLFSVLISAFEGFYAIKYRVYTDKILLNILKLAFIVFFGILGYGVRGIVFAYTLATALTCLVAFYFLETRVFSLRTAVQPVYAKKELILFSLPLVVYGFIKTLDAEISTAMLGYFRSTAEVGIYNAVVPTVQVLTIIATSFGVLFLPVITELYAKEQKETLKKVYKTVIKWTVYANLPLLMLMVFFPAYLMRLLFGPEYLTGSLALSILGVGFFIKTLAFAPFSLIAAVKASRAMVLISLAGVLTEVTVNLFLTPIYGATGAAAAAASSGIVNSTLAFAYSQYVIGVSPFSTGMMRAIPSGLLSMGAVYLGGKLIFGSLNIYSMLLLFAVFLSLYAVSLLALNGLGQEDVEILNAIEKRTGIRSELLRNIVKRFVK